MIGEEYHALPTHRRSGAVESADVARVGFVVDELRRAEWHV